MSRALTSLVLTCCCAAAILVSGAVAQDAKERAKPRGRLPAFYKDVVTPQQRDQIYAIQAKYVDQISKLQEQINQLAAQRDKEIEDLLTAEQKEQIQKLRDARKKASSASKDGNATDDDSDAAATTTAAQPSGTVARPAAK